MLSNTLDTGPFLNDRRAAGGDSGIQDDITQQHTTDGMLQSMDAVAATTFPEFSSGRLSSQFCDPDSGLRAITECEGSAVVVHVGGDIDASNEVSWQRLLRRVANIAIAPGPFVIDVSQLDFMGSCAYSVMAQESVRCKRRGVSLRLVSDQPIVARTVAACRLGGLLPIYGTVDTALWPVSDPR
jgi:anti-anti-sigma factor